MNHIQRETVNLPSRMIPALACLLAAVWTGLAAAATGKNPYPAMAPLGQYRMASEAQEIALAKSAAPASISDHAEVLVLGEHGYVTAVKGGDGFVCIVTRSWDNDYSSSEFWNPKARGPQCMNPAAARSVLPGYLMRTEWALAGLSKAGMEKREKAARAAGKLTAPESGSVVYMMSKSGYLNDAAAGPWRPHVMFFMPGKAATLWGANLPGSPVMAGYGGDITTFFVLVPDWSDGTLAPAFK